MVKLSRRTPTGVKSIEYPDNLTPTVFKCVDCGSTIRRLDESDSYILMTTSKEVDSGTKKICPYCYRLKQYNGVE